MENKLQQLTQKLYDEGLEKGRAEAERLVAEAKTNAAKIVKEAEAQAAKILFEKRYRWNEPVRAVCVRAINLIPRSRPIQLDLFGDNERHARREQLTTA